VTLWLFVVPAMYMLLGTEHARRPVEAPAATPAAGG